VSGAAGGKTPPRARGDGIEAARERLAGFADSGRARTLQRFFKTGPGEYGEGDLFLGVRVPDVRRTAKEHLSLGIKEVKCLLRSPLHEERLLALLIMVGRYGQGDGEERNRIYRLYLGSTRWINNWDLVDVTAPHIIGAHLWQRDRSPLTRLARSTSLWERRIAVLSTFTYVRRDDFGDTLRIAGLLLDDGEDLIHKAVGWMLREVGKRDRKVEEEFLRKHAGDLPRTMLRYAIERFPEGLRLRYLKREGRDRRVSRRPRSSG
jgi:3-methyladenine DNA glycosylase AlkD